MSSTKPKRIQLSRRKGFRKPPGCVVVTRASRWGNPFKVTDHVVKMAAAGLRHDTNGEPDERHAAVILYRFWLAGHLDALPLIVRCLLPKDMPKPPTREEVVAALRGRDLGCFCPDDTCHASVLLSLANDPEAA